MKKRRILILLILLAIAIVFAVEDHKESIMPNSGERGSISDAELEYDTENGGSTPGSSQGVLSKLERLLSFNGGSQDSFFSDNTSSGNVETDNTSLQGPYRVVRVVDGDTYIINIDGKDETVRLIGVDTPESVAQGERASANCKEGKEVSEYMKRLLTGENVYLEYDVSHSDKYGRTLAYVYHDGEQLERLLLREGYARAMTIPPNINYASDYEKLQKEARENKAGFWKTNPWERSN